MTFTIRRWYFLPILFLFSVFFVLFGQSTVRAAEPTSLDSISRASYQFVDRSIIEVTVGAQKYTFLDTNIGDETYLYKIQGGGECADAEILLAQKYDNGYTEFDIFGVQGGGSGARISEAKLGYRTGGQGRCVYETFYDKIATNTPNAAIWFRWVDAGTIERVDGRSQEIFVQSTAEGVDKRVFIDRSEGKCADIMIVSTDLRSAKMYRLEDNKENGEDSIKQVNSADATLLTPVFSDECEVYGNVQAEGSSTGGDTVVKSAGVINPNSFTLANFDASTKAVGSGGLIGGGTSSNNGDDEALGPDCYSGIATAFAWIICPVLGIIDNFLEWAERTVIGYLDVDIGNEGIPELRSSWAIFARIASIILVLIALTMVISTALGFGIFDAYTVKKVLPRLVIATIAIWLSFSLILTYIEIMNVIGLGIGELMLAPFGDGAKDFSLQNIIGEAADNTNAGTEAVFTALAAGTIAGGVAGIGGPLALISLAVAAALGFIVAVVVLTLRQMIIILLLILAPLGIVAWILPNTQKIWKLWFETLNKLLLMFPMIVALLAAGKIFAYLFTQTGQSGVLSLVVPLIAYILPFFLMVTLFKASGTAFGKISGAVTNGGKGLTGKVRAPLDNAAKQNKAFKDQIASEKLGRQAALGAGFTGAQARTRMRIRGGQPIAGGKATLRNRGATQERVESSLAASLDKIEQTQLSEAETALKRDTSTYNDFDALLRVATSADSSDAQVRAAMGRLAQTKATNQLAAARTSLHSSGRGEVWDKFSTDKFSDLREFAPQLAGTGPQNTRNGIPVDPFIGASTEAAAKWNQDTWDTAARTSPATASRLAAGIMSNDRLRQNIGGNFESPGHANNAGLQGFLGNLAGSTSTPTPTPAPATGGSAAPGIGGGPIPVGYRPTVPPTGGGTAPAPSTNNATTPGIGGGPIPVGYRPTVPAPGGVPDASGAPPAPGEVIEPDGTRRANGGPGSGGHLL